MFYWGYLELYISQDFKILLFFREKDFEIFVKWVIFAENDIIMTKAELRATLLNELNAFLDDDVMMQRAIYALRALRDDSMGCDILREPPCQYSIEELKQRLIRTETEAMSGEGVNEEEMNSIIDSIL